MAASDISALDARDGTTPVPMSTPAKDADGHTVIQHLIGILTGGIVSPITSGQPMPVADAVAASAFGTQLDAAWISGSGSIVALLKAVVAAIKGTSPATGAVSVPVAAVVASTPLLVINPSRKRYVLFNDTMAQAYVLEGSGQVSPDNFSFQLAPGQSYLTTDWSGAVSALWTAAGGNMRVTEQT